MIEKRAADGESEGLDMATVMVHHEGRVRRIEAETGSRVIDILSAAGILLSAPCGGRCFCGKCAIRAAGALNGVLDDERRFLTDAQIARGYRLACACALAGDAEIEVEAERADILTDGANLSIEVDPPAKVVCVACEMPTLSDPMGDEDRLRAVLNGANRLPLHVLRQLPDALRAGDRMDALVFRGAEGTDVLRVAPALGPGYGVAVDIGTTTVAAYLVALDTGAVVQTASTLNPQRAYGGDVISRVDHTMKEEQGLRRLAEMIRTLIDGLILKMTEQQGIPAESIYHIACVGNTIMMHFLMELPARYIAVTPFVPAYNRLITLPAAEFGLSYPSAVLTAGPSVAGYVGADTVAAAMAAGMDVQKETALLIDIGTNGEIALRCGDRVLCCSAAAGPAFEGAHIRCGSGAVPGAIDHVSIEGGEIRFTTILSAPAKSLCGSGLIDAIACMLDAGILDETGRIDEDETSEQYAKYLIDVDGKPAVQIAPEVYVTQQDVREVQLAKSAIISGVRILMDRAEVEYDQITALYLAGGFGNFIDRRSAAKIGLLPAELEEKTVPIGNGAGTGARMMLVNRGALERADALGQRMEYIELSAQADFQELFAEYMLFE